jgi:hypothetical protein
MLASSMNMASVALLVFTNPSIEGRSSLLESDRPWIVQWSGGDAALSLAPLHVLLSASRSTVPDGLQIY